MPARFTLRSIGRDDYAVLLDGKAAGRIMLYKNGPDPFWQWFVHGLIPSPPGSMADRGTAPTREAAMSAWRAAYEAIEAGPHSAHPEPAMWRGREP